MDVKNSELRDKSEKQNEIQTLKHWHQFLKHAQETIAHIKNTQKQNKKSMLKT